MVIVIGLGNPGNIHAAQRHNVGWMVLDGLVSEEALHFAEKSIVYDDIDIVLGTIKCSFGRGAGGHNGVQSVIDHLGTKDFLRIRIGVRPVHEELLPRIAPPDGFEKFLLSNFAPFEIALRDQGIEQAIKVIESLPHKTKEEIMNEYN
jgi:PTH1 family peptidyl-tRNA hydrolase